MLKITHLIIASLTAAGLTSAEPVKDISELKALQSKVQTVSKKVMPATVSLFSGKNGASGSGVIVNKDGLILTAGHVIRGATEMTVTFPNGKTAKAKVLGANFTRDSGMCQIIGDGKWPFAEVGTSKNLQPGDYVVALGHAGGFDPIRTPPVRFGRIISRSKNKFITTNCTLIGGDSGGPLFDLNGRVVGIHSSIGMRLDANNHASIEGFHEDWKKLQAGDSWGRLGGSKLDNPDAPVLGIFTEEAAQGGIGVRHVIEGGPAQKAGLRAGDILRSINGKATSSLQKLHAALTQYRPGQTVTLRLTRGEKSIIRKVKLGKRGNLR